jgi:hypothetical protein
MTRLLQLGSFPFVSRHPRCPRQVQVCKSATVISNMMLNFANMYTALMIITSNPNKSCNFFVQKCKPNYKTGLKVGQLNKDCVPFLQVGFPCSFLCLKFSITIGTISFMGRGLPVESSKSDQKLPNLIFKRQIRRPSLRLILQSRKAKKRGKNNAMPYHGNSYQLAPHFTRLKCEQCLRTGRIF